MVLYSFDFVRRTLAVLASLIDDRSHQQFSWVELAYREALKPGLLAASETLKLCSPVVPQLDVDAWQNRTTAIESVYWSGEEKAKPSVFVNCGGGTLKNARNFGQFD